MNIKNILVLLALIISVNLSAQKTEAVKGVFDVSEVDFSKNNIKLNGEWAFYSSTFLEGEQLLNNQLEPDTLLGVPHLWNDWFEGRSDISGYGYGTYQLTLRGLEPKIRYALKMNTMGTSATFFADGKQIGSSGKPGVDKQSTVPRYKPQVLTFTAQSDSAIISVHMANFSHHKGGLWHEIYIGTEQNVYKLRISTLVIEGMLAGSILLMALYHLALYLIRRRKISPLVYALFSSVLALRLSVTGEFLMNYIFEFPWAWQLKLDYLTLYFAIPSFSGFVYILYKEEYNYRFLQVLFVLSSIMVFITLFFSGYIASFVVLYGQLTAAVGSIYVIFVLIKAIRNKREEAIELIIGFVIFFLCVVNDIMYHNELLYTVSNMFAVGLGAFVFSQAYVLSVRFNKSFIQTEQLTEELGDLNENLEGIVEERTNSLQEANTDLIERNEEILQQKEEMMAQRDEIEHQRDEARHAHEQIMNQNRKITDSISYASRIQNAVLPPPQMLEAHLNDYFVYSKPRDIVSGDFYWSKKIDDSVVIAVADSTGHGVPGAFMSLLGTALLSESVMQIPQLNASKILNKLREKLIESLHRNKNRGLRDGMDIAMLIIEGGKRRMQYAGAHNPLYIIRKGELLEFKGDRMPIGAMNKNDKSFRNRVVELKENDMVYLFTDGFYDQIGGPKDRKFMRKNFKKMLERMSPLPLAQQKEEINIVYEVWRGSNKQVDDILILGFRVV